MSCPRSVSNEPSISVCRRPPGQFLTFWINAVSLDNVDFIYCIALTLSLFAFSSKKRRCVSMEQIISSHLAWNFYVIDRHLGSRVPEHKVSYFPSRQPYPSTNGCLHYDLDDDAASRIRYSSSSICRGFPTRRRSPAPHVSVPNIDMKRRTPRHNRTP